MRHIKEIDIYEKRPIKETYIRDKRPLKESTAATAGVVTQRPLK